MEILHKYENGPSHRDDFTFDCLLVDIFRQHVKALEREYTRRELKKTDLKKDFLVFAKDRLNKIVEMK